MSTPAFRLARLLSEGARFSVDLPGQTGIDVTPDVIATLAQVRTQAPEFEPVKESIDSQ